ncbi:MAG: aspartate/glutamate racemase family protein [Castellaniella sp.]|nr:aspartate/glutamate racemase family protein [Castellaniella sp.]
MDKTIYVINPNCLAEVTRGLKASLAPFEWDAGPRIECMTLRDGPPGIQTEQHVESAALLVGRLVADLEQTRGDQVGAYVIACFSDPGLYLARDQTRKPVLGIQECGLLAAMSLGQRVGVIAILKTLMNRHARAYAAAGITSRIAGELPLSLGVAELQDEGTTRARLLEVGRRLRDEYGSEVLVLGCAGMPQYRAWLEDQLVVPVIDPTKAAVAMALGRVLDAG